MKRITIYETKQCGDCKEDFQSSQYNKSGLCKRCAMNRHNKRNRLKKEEYKKPYPLDCSEQKKRYRRILRELKETTTKEQRRAIYKRELEYMIEIGIWEWCMDRRTDEKKNKSIGNKLGRPKDNEIILEHPDTRYMNE